MVDGLGQQISIVEGVEDPLRKERVMVIAGVSHQGPARTVGPAHDVGEIGDADEALSLAPSAHPVGQVRRQGERCQVVPADVRADGQEILDRSLDRHHHELVVRGKGNQEASVLRKDRKLGALDRDPGPVGSVGKRPRRHCAPDRRQRRCTPAR